MGNEREEKNLLRQRCAAVRDGMDPKKKKAADEAICARVLSLAGFRYARTVLLYSPVKSEVDVRPVLRAALEKGKNAALPLCENDRGEMTFRLITSEEDLRPGRFGIAEPPERAPALDERALADPSLFALIPALAFDREGARLGYGKGYYDRFLGKYRGICAGVVYRELIFDSLPRGRYDRKVQLLVSQGGVILCHA